MIQKYDLTETHSFIPLNEKKIYSDRFKYLKYYIIARPSYHCHHQPQSEMNN